MNGNPVRDVGITLVSADAQPEQILSQGRDRSPGLTTFTSQVGAYSFSHLMPGRYLLLVKRESVSLGPAIVSGLPLLFYPGVSDAKAATAIVIEKEQKPQAYDFILPIQQQ